MMTIHYQQEDQELSKRSGYNKIQGPGKFPAATTFKKVRLLPDAGEHTRKDHSWTVRPVSGYTHDLQAATMREREEKTYKREERREMERLR